MSAMMDPEMMAAMSDPKMMAAMCDPKMMAAMSDPKMLAAMSDPKMMSDPNLMAMYAMGMPGMMPPMSSASSSMSNGVSAGTPLPSSKGGTAKPKPGTVAAALQEKKESEKARGDVVPENHETTNHDRSIDENDSDEGLNLSVSKNGASEHPTKLEALLAKPIDDLPHPSDKGLNGEPPRTEGV